MKYIKELMCSLVRLSFLLFSGLTFGATTWIPIGSGGITVFIPYQPEQLFQAPANTAIDSNNGSIVFSWSDVEHASKYQVQAQNAQGEWVTILTTEELFTVLDSRFTGYTAVRVIACNYTSCSNTGAWSSSLAISNFVPEAPPSPHIQPIPNRNAISDSVGAIAGQFRVNEGGQANYSVPIFTPTGVAGVKPTLALSYNSAGGNGHLGIGWGITGTSAITRCGKSDIIDGEFGSVNLDYNDKFCIDGQRLVLISGEYGKSGSEYRTVIASQTKVIARGATGEGPEYFDVWRKDGSFSRYGGSSDSQFLSNRVGIVSDTVFTWAQTYSEDRYQNRISYYYNEDEVNGEFYIDRVEYSPNVIIQFNYIDRNDYRKGYALGGNTRLSKLLDSVTVSDGGNEVRRYDLDYLSYAGSSTSRLRSITESKDGVSLPPTTFNWANPPKGLERDLEEKNGINYSTGTFINVDNDLTPEWIHIVNDENVLINKNTGQLSYSDDPDAIVATKLYVHQFNFTDEAYLNSCLDYIPGNVAEGRNFEVFDINGDGIDEAIVTTQSEVIAVFFDGQGCLAPLANRTQKIADIDIGNNIKNWFFGDINGDALPDIVYQRANQVYVKYHLGSNQTSNSMYSQENPAHFEITSISEPDPVEVDNVSKYIRTVTPSPKSSSFADFNGDGRVDMLVKVIERIELNREYCQDRSPNDPDCINPNQSGSTFTYWLVFTSNGNNQFKEMINLGSLPGVRESKDLRIIDINLDGMPDILYKNSSNNKWEYRLFTGKRFLSGVSTGVNKDHSIYFGDHDLNGFNEMYYFKGNELYRREFNKNGNLSYEFNTRIRGASGWPFWQVDINADGELDLITVERDEHTFYTNYDNYAAFNKSPFQVKDRINTINNGMGNITKITYKALNDPSQPNLYESHKGWQFDAQGHLVFKHRGPQYVVSKAESSSPYHSNVNNFNSIDYRYGKSRSHSKYGSMGFEWLETIDNQTNMITRTTYKQAYPHIGSPLQTTIWYGERTNARLLSQSNSFYTYKNVGSYIKDNGTQGNIIFPYLSEAREDSYDFNVSGLQNFGLVSRTITTNQYNNYGDPTLQSAYVCQSSNINCKSGGWVKKTQTQNQYKPADLSNWILGRLKKSTVNHSLQGKPTVTRTSEFEYSNITGILKAEIIEPNGSQVEYLKTAYQHDNYGNVIRKTVCNVASNCNRLPTSNPYSDAFDNRLVHQTSSTQYDSNGRYVLRTFNGYGQKTSEVLAYNELGQPTQVKDIFGNISEKKYGTFGAEYFARTSTGGWQKTIKQLCSGLNDCPTEAYIRVETTSAGGSRAYQYLDLLGREVKTSAQGFGDFDVVTITRYDSQGRLSAKSKPYRTNRGESALFATTHYDILNRVYQVDYPDGSKDKTFYDGFDFSEQAAVIRIQNDLGQTKKEYRDITGKLVKVVDNIQSQLTYDYNATGDLLTVHLNSSIQSRIEYDRLGRKIKMWDWDKGAQNNRYWSYTYNSLDKLLSQTDAKNQLSQIVYDREGRKVRQIDKNAAGARVADSRWQYENSTAVNGYIGQLIEQFDVINTDFKLTPIYDGYGRKEGVTALIDGEAFNSSTRYDQYGRVFQEFDVSGNSRGLRYVYNDKGYLKQVKEAQSGTRGKIYKTIRDMDAYGNVIREDLGNGIITTRHYKPETGRIERIISQYDTRAPIQEITYDWDSLGRLKYRNSIVKGLIDNFTYDDLNRVDTVNGVDKFDYAPNGNITRKQGVGNYAYGATCNGVKAGHHAVSSAGGKNYCYDFNGNMVSDTERTITYATFDKPTQIVKGNQTTQFAYSGSRSRYKRIDNNNGDVTTTYYLGSAELVIKSNGQRSFRRSVPGGVVNIGSNQPEQVSYIHTDHLGSTDVITNASGSVVEEVSFDEFGEKRLPNNWQVKDSSLKLTPLNITTKGFTGHEMAESVGIIHMNGRIYDPNLGRFLQADPYVDGATDSQGYNRYSYVRNNPLAYTDPTGFKRSGGLKNFQRLMKAESYHMGFVFGGVLGAITSGYLINNYKWAQQAYSTVATAAAAYFCGPCSAAVAAGTSFHTTAINGGNVTQSAQAGARSYAVALISGQISNAIGASYSGAGGHNNLLLASFQHGMLGGVMSELQGGKFGHGFASSFVSKFAGETIGLKDLIKGDEIGHKITRTMIAGIIGGTISEATGGKFANGAMQSAIQWAFNAETTGAKSLKKFKSCQSMDTHLVASCISRQYNEGIADRIDTERKYVSTRNKNKDKDKNSKQLTVSKDEPASLSQLESFFLQGSQVFGRAFSIPNTKWLTEDAAKASEGALLFWFHIKARETLTLEQQGRFSKMSNKDKVICLQDPKKC